MTEDFEINSTSQLGQDLWVIDTLNYKENGFFLDIGALDGVTHSNTYMLENRYNWNGICIEANPYVIHMLSSNRNCMCVNSLLYSEEGLIKDFHCGNELSFLPNKNRDIDIDYFKKYLEKQNVEYHKITMKTSTISKILDIYNAPFVIDYMSVDTEGTELDILKAFPFDDYHVNTITVEHNAGHIGNNYQKEIRDFLENNDFEFVKSNDPVENWNHGPVEDYYKNKQIYLTDTKQGTSVKVTQYILPN